MKRFTIFASLVIASLMSGAAAHAGLPDGLADGLSKLKKNEAKPYRQFSDVRAERVEADRARMAAAAEAKSEGPRFRLKDAAMPRLADAVAKRERLDSIVCGMNSTGERVSLQTFEYDEKNQPKLRVNYLPDNNGGWAPIEYYGYDWDEEGYCLSQWGYSDVYNSGQRYDYTYNDRNLGDTQVIYNYVDGEWIPLSRGEYWYDEAGNLNEEKVYDYIDGQWVPYAWTKVTFDAAGRQTSYETLTWSGSGWEHIDDRMEYAYDDAGHQTLWSFYRWQDDSQSYLNYYRIEQDFNDDGLITRQENKYWNPDLQTWDGAYNWGMGVCVNWKTLFEYDGQGRRTYERSYNAYTAGNYVPSAVNYTTYKELDGGESEEYRVSTLYDHNGENPWDEGRLTKRYDADGNLIYDFEMKFENGRWVNKYADEYVYDGSGNELLSCSYGFDENNQRYNDLRMEMAYDGYNNLVASDNYMGTGSGDADWEPYTRFTYAYERDTVRIEKLAYIWDGSAFVPNWGDGAVYDYDVPVDALVMWIGVDTYHKLIENRSYVAAGSEWDYQSFKYYYTDIVPTGIGHADAADGVQGLKSAVVTDRLDIMTDSDVDICIYDMQGTCRLKARGTGIDVSQLPSGLYVARFGTASAKFIKR